MWTATLDNPPCRQKGLHDRIQLSSHNLKVGKSTQLNTEICHSEWNDKSVGFSSKPPSSANKEDDKSISSYGCDEKRPVKNPEPGFHQGFLSDFTQVNIQKITFKNELMDHPAWWFLDYGTFLLTLVISLLIKVLICLPRTEICVKPCYTQR